MHVISSRGIEADPGKLQAIPDLPPPQNLQEVRTFLGMVNQLSKFSEHLADKAKSIRELLLEGISEYGELSNRKHLSRSKLTPNELQYWHMILTRKPR